ncbi:RNA polymerase sigma factor [Mobilisporobacter senegalensis]|uniref:RNA polymerase sigma factor n=1 Tax=Mobilisporobacter senegalensis TaxID=1329262 RepID=UPI000F483ECF|nr:RNA polymerase sigma factor [Mobilisporobacter senegalensis]
MNYTKYELDDFFNKVFLEMYEEIFRYVRRLTNDSRVLEDILQETFFEAYKKIDILIEHENYRGWIYKTARFKALKLNSRVRKTDNKQVELVLSEVQELGQHDQYDFITYADYKEVLSESEFNYLYKHYIEGYTYEELALEENIQIGACKMRMSRILKKLRKSLIYK